MSETYGGEHSEKARRQDEGNTLSDTLGSEASELEYGRDLSAAQLDRYLTAAAAFYRWKTHLQDSQIPEEQERNGEYYLKLQRVLNGTYQHEKANFALNEAHHYRKEADESRDALQLDFSDERDPESAKAGIQLGVDRYSTYAANWLRVAANCLEMPIERPPHHTSTFEQE